MFLRILRRVGRHSLPSARSSQRAPLGTPCRSGLAGSVSEPCHYVSVPGCLSAPWASVMPNPGRCAIDDGNHPEPVNLNDHPPGAW